MPMSRYEIRNEYSLADPDLYRAADKDDPEALLEGVAMAGLVGLLRQLGDLAEFAAEIFHDLHEEVVTTAARGHGLMVRVQQLESEVPYIEKAFLSQTDHSSFFYSAGVDWHRNLPMDQNLVTQGDLPRFVMDSYEECRGPPRLFLLDKFDVAGAGACLKRYTDPSFFKIEPPMMTSADVQREKKIRKAKKKGPRWRNGGTPEVMPTSHAKLHQLFLEERVDNGVNKPARRVTLKRRLNGFPFDSRTGKSYMEKLLRSPSPEHKVLREVDTSSSLAMLPINGHNESGLEVVEYRSVSPERERTGRKRSPPGREEIISNPSMHEPYEIYRDDKSCEVSNSYPRMVSDEVSYTIANVNGDRDISLGEDSKIGGSLTGYESDGIASEVDNYVDAPSTIGSEIDTDSELRVKSNSTSSFFKTQPPYANEDLSTRSSDSQSTGERTMSVEGNTSFKKETSSFCSSGSRNSSAENLQRDRFLAAGLVSADVPDIDLVDDASSTQKTLDEDVPQDDNLNPVVTDYTCTSTDEIPNHSSDFEQLPASLLCSSESIVMLTHSDSEGSGRKDSFREPELADKGSALDDEDKRINIVMDQMCNPSVSDSTSQPGDDYLRSSAGEHVDEELNTMNLPRMYAVSENINLTDSSGPDGRNLIENIELSPHTCNAPSQNTSDTLKSVHIESPKPDKLDEIPELHEECSSDRPDMADNADNILSIAVPAGEKVRDELDDEDSVIFDENPEHFSYIMESSPGNDFSEASLVTARNGDGEELYTSYSTDNHLSSENLILQCSDYSPDRREDVTDSYEADGLKDDINENLDPGTPKSCHDLSSIDSAATESSCGSPEILVEQGRQFDNIENKCITSHTIPVLEVEVDENLVSADTTSLNKSACEVEQTETADMVSAAPEVSDNTDANSCSLNMGGQEEEETRFVDSDMDSAAPEVSDNTDRNSGGLILDGQQMEEHTRSTDSDMDELEDHFDSVVISHRDLDLVDEVGHGEGTSSDSSSVSCNDTDDVHLNSEVPDSVRYPDNDSSKSGLDLGNAATVKLQSGLDGEKENLQQNGSMINDSDVSSSPLDFNAELLLDSRETRLGLSPVVAVNSYELPDRDDRKEDNSSGFMFSLVNYPGLPLSSELPGGNNCDTTVSELPTDPLGSTFAPRNLSYKTTQITLDEVPPLPPLPPVQWRMGKLFQGSSITGGEKMKQDVLPVAVSPPVAFADAISSSPEEVDHSLSQISPDIAPEEEKMEHGLSSFASSSLLEERDYSLVQIAPEIVPKEEKDEHASTSFEATVMDETNELQPEMENELLQPTVSTYDVCSSSEELNDTLIQTDPEKAPVSEKVELDPSSQDACDMSKQIDLQPEIESVHPQATVSQEDPSPPLENMNHSTISISSKTVLEQEKVQQSSSSEDNAISENKIVPQKVENEDDCDMSKQIDLQPEIENVHPQATVSQEDPSPPLENMNHSMISISSKTVLEQEKFQQSSSSEDNAISENKIVPQKVENEQLKLLLPFTVRELPLPAEEDGASNVIRPKLPRPRNPLVNDVSALDKSKLRKVTERVRPPIEKVDERDSLLEQIRNKSFNLKPAMASRPSIHGPQTNLRVAAILEKANQIRQAFAGSDDEDDDNWSDS